ncbi:TPA: ead/Ea22-like family protein [Escherichia coli]|nr:ead/Ea22-like family protein [Escherichia coli]HCP9919427.1 ead/Ea22-like family protein [Escherichia coli]HCP9954214.1 ead/Ea22-like family protein [Escherichia coli]HCQ0001813.1 ead/Ea22-like family protein [Escherichia coli]HCQ0064489.1 ead/Ea22-like family protein [Escherichia coli]
MSNIGYQELREAAEAIKVVATPQKLLAFRMKVTPQVVLALLDERERNQQYIKRRDQENEDIALTVGKLRVELEGKDRRITEVTMWIKRLSSSLKNAKPDSKLPDDAMIWLNNEGLTSIEDILR